MYNLFINPYCASYVLFLDFKLHLPYVPDRSLSICLSTSASFPNCLHYSFSSKENSNSKIYSVCLLPLPPPSQPPPPYSAVPSPVLSQIKPSSPVTYPCTTPLTPCCSPCSNPSLCSSCSAPSQPPPTSMTTPIKVMPNF